MSGKVRYVLYYLNGSYIEGYSAMDKKPFEELNLVADGEETVNDYINKRQELKGIVYRTNEFLTGFYSDFGLELLSTIDYISRGKGTFDRAEITTELKNWSNRKRTLFSNEKYIDISLDHLQKATPR